MVLGAGASSRVLGANTALTLAANADANGLVQGRGLALGGLWGYLDLHLSNCSGQRSCGRWCCSVVTPGVWFLQDGRSEHERQYLFCQSAEASENSELVKTPK